MRGVPRGIPRQVILLEAGAGASCSETCFCVASLFLSQLSVLSQKEVLSVGVNSMYCWEEVSSGSSYVAIFDRSHNILKDKFLGGRFSDEHVVKTFFICITIFDFYSNYKSNHDYYEYLSSLYKLNITECVIPKVKLTNPILIYIDLCSYDYTNIYYFIKIIL